MNISASLLAPTLSNSSSSISLEARATADCADMRLRGRTGHTACDSSTWES
jgi:hypothetical protein